MIAVKPDHPKRDELAVENAKFLSWKRLMGGPKPAEEVRDLAHDLERQGATQREIYDETGKHVDQANETGLMRNSANQWIFELGDKGALIKPEFYNDFFPRLDPRGGGDAFDKLENLYDHPELYKRMPEIGKTPTSLVMPKHVVTNPMSAQGSYSRMDKDNPEGAIFAQGHQSLDPNHRDPNSILGVLNHEVNHGIQDRDLLPYGSTESGALDKNWATHMDPYFRSMFLQRNVERQGRPKGMTGDDWMQMHPEWQDAATNAEAGRNYTPYEKYRRGTAGEQASEMSANRLNWTMNQRNATPAFTDEATQYEPMPFQMNTWSSGEPTAPPREVLARWLTEQRLRNGTR